MWPVQDDRNPFEVLLPRIKAASEKYDMTPVPDYPYFDPQPWDNKTDTSLPGALTPYFLRAGTAPRYLVGGAVVSTLITRAESNGSFTIGSLEGSSRHSSNPLLQDVKFTSSHHCFLVTDGIFDFQIEANGTTQLQPAETLYIPKNTKFSLKFGTRFARAYVFSNGGGLVEVFRRAGTLYSFPMIPEKEDTVNIGHLQSLASEIGAEF